LTDARCPICGKVYSIPEGRGRAMLETKFLRHKDACSLPRLGEMVRVGATLAVVDGIDEASGEFPRLTLHLPSGREEVLEAGEVGRVRDQDAARERFFG
jgi:hypothetical protein